MTIIKRGSSYWVDIGFNLKRYRKRSPINTVRGARAYEFLLRTRLARGEPINGIVVDQVYLFSDIATKWLELYVRNNGKPSGYSMKQYMMNAGILPFFKSKHLHEITTLDIEEYKHKLLYQLNIAPKTVNNRLSLMNRCLKSAVEWGFLKEKPIIKFVKLPPVEFDFLTEDEFQMLLAHARKNDQDMMLLAVRTGLRFGEIIALRWTDIELDKQLLTVRRNIVRGFESSPKNNKTRTIPLTKSVVEMLEARDKGTPFIFSDTKGRPQEYKTSLQRLHRICNRANIRRIGWHVFRHTFASHLAAKNNSIVAIKDLLGHSDIKMTLRYAHINMSVLKNTVETLEYN